jgi:hypothetical protein
MRAMATCLVAGMLMGSGTTQAQTICRSSDAQTTNMIGYMKVLAGATLPADSESVGIRTTYRIPATSPAQVTLVTTEQTCKSALAAFISAVPGQSPTPTRIYVVAVGSVYVVWNPYRSANSEWSTNVVFNSRFQVLSMFGG